MNFQINLIRTDEFVKLQSFARFVDAFKTGSTEWNFTLVTGRICGSARAFNANNFYGNGGG